MAPVHRDREKCPHCDKSLRPRTIRHHLSLVARLQQNSHNTPGEPGTLTAPANPDLGMDDRDIVTLGDGQQGEGA
jgi:hypothetical protein